MDGLSLRQLRYFDALARALHFGRAAEACAVSQPALSVQIREMESRLGAALVERGGRAVRLTPLGAVLAARVGGILRDVEALGDLARAARSPLSGRLAVGVIPTVAPYLLPDFIRAMAARYPGVEIAPREAKTDRLVADLEQGRLDAAILALPLGSASLVETPVFQEEFVLARPRADAGKPAPDARMLREMQLLLLEEGHCFRDQALSFCRAGGRTPRAVMEGSSLGTLTQMVGAGIGVTLLPEMAVAVERRAAPVSVTRLAPPRPSRTIGMAWRRSAPLGEQLVEIAAVLRVCRGARGDGVRRSAPVRR